MKKALFLRRALLTGLCCAGLMLGGCSDEFFDTAAFGVFQDTEVNLNARNAAAADYLDQQAKTFAGAQTQHLVKAVTLSDADESRVQSKIGRLIPEQVGLRLSYIGYRMDLSEVLQGDDTNYLKPAMQAGEAPDYILSGTYKRGRLDLEVSLRMTEVRTQRVVAVFDYALPMNNDIAEMSKPETRIFKVTE